MLVVSITIAVVVSSVQVSNIVYNTLLYVGCTWFVPTTSQVSTCRSLFQNMPKSNYREFTINSDYDGEHSQYAVVALVSVPPGSLYIVKTCPELSTALHIAAQDRLSSA